MKVEDRAHSRRLAPFDEIVEFTDRAFAINERRFLNNDLIESEPDMIEPERSDIVYVAAGDKAVEMLEIALGEREPPLVGQNVKTLVIRKPAADSHTFNQFVCHFSVLLRRIRADLRRIRF